MKKKYIFYLIFVNLIFFSASSKILAADNSSITLNLNVPVGNITGGKVNAQLLDNYLAAWYNFLLGSVGIIATIIIMWGGFKWLFSRGDTKQISDAKDTIFSAIAGLILAFGSYLIISLVNPNLTKIKMPEISDIKLNINSKGSAYDPLSKPTQTNRQLEPFNPENKNKGPKVPCPSNSNGQIDYGMAYIASHEGYSNQAYTDAIDSNTQDIYFGHQIQSGENFNGTEEEAIEVLQNDYDRYRDQARNVASQHEVNFDNLSAGRQAVLIDMAYNMGGASLNNFNNMWSAIRENNFEQASREILNSRYYDQLQKTGRPQMNAAIMAANPNEGDEMLQEQASVNCQ